MWIFATIMLTGALLFAVSLAAILKTKWGIIPAIGALVGIGVMFFLPGVAAGPEGIAVSPATQWWMEWHDTCANIAFVILIITIAIDLICAILGHPLSQENQIRDNGVTTDADFIKKARNQEIILLVIALFVSIGIFGAYKNAMSQPDHVLLDVARVARERGFRVQLNPFIVETPGKDYADLESVKRDARSFAASRGAEDLQFEHVYSVRFIARDNNMIDEIVLIFDGTIKSDGAEERAEIPADLAKGVRGFPKVEAGRSPLEKQAISIFLKRSKEETTLIGRRLLDSYQSSYPRGGSGFRNLQEHPDAVEGSDFRISPFRDGE
jgi:hypothetical protein